MVWIDTLLNRLCSIFSPKYYLKSVIKSQCAITLHYLLTFMISDVFWNSLSLLHRIETVTKKMKTRISIWEFLFLAVTSCETFESCLYVCLELCAFGRKCLEQISFFFLLFSFFFSICSLKVPLILLCWNIYNRWEASCTVFDSVRITIHFLEGLLCSGADPGFMEIIDLKIFKI